MTSIYHLTIASLFTMLFVSPTPLCACDMSLEVKDVVKTTSPSSIYTGRKRSHSTASQESYELQNEPRAKRQKLELVENYQSQEQAELSALLDEALDSDSDSESDDVPEHQPMPLIGSQFLMEVEGRTRLRVVQESHEESQLESLPFDLLEAIFLSLDMESLINARLICKTFYEILEARSAIKRELLKYFDDENNVFSCPAYFNLNDGSSLIEIRHAHRIDKEFKYLYDQNTQQDKNLLNIQINKFINMCPIDMNIQPMARMMFFNLIAYANSIDEGQIRDLLKIFQSLNPLKQKKLAMNRMDVFYKVGFHNLEERQYSPFMNYFTFVRALPCAFLPPALLEKDFEETVNILSTFTHKADVLFLYNSTPYGMEKRLESWMKLDPKSRMILRNQTETACSILTNSHYNFFEIIQSFIDDDKYKNEIFMNLLFLYYDSVSIDGKEMNCSDLAYQTNWLFSKKDKNPGEILTYISPLFGKMRCGDFLQIGSDIGNIPLRERRAFFQTSAIILDERLRYKGVKDIVALMIGMTESKRIDLAVKCNEFIKKNDLLIVETKGIAERSRLLCYCISTMARLNLSLGNDEFLGNFIDEVLKDIEEGNKKASSIYSKDKTRDLVYKILRLYHRGHPYRDVALSKIFKYGLNTGA